MTEVMQKEAETEPLAMKKEDETAAAARVVDDPSSGFIRFVIPISTIKTSGIYSPVTEVMGVPWSLLVQNYDGHFGVYLHHRKSRSNMWSIDVIGAIKIVNADPKEDASFELVKTTYSRDFPTGGCRKFIKWDDLSNEKKGFIKDGKITVEAQFSLSKIIGIRAPPHIDFMDSNYPHQDVALVIDGQKIYVSKQYLSIYSEVFNVMFYGGFSEKNKDEIELKDVDREQFIELLKVIYPSCAKITDENAEYLLKLGDQYMIKTVVDKVEQFLITSTKFDVCDKLKLSDKYRLILLQDHCLETFKTFAEMKKIQGTDGYKSLSEGAKSALMDVALTLN